MSLPRSGPTIRDRRLAYTDKPWPNSVRSAEKHQSSAVKSVMLITSARDDSNQTFRRYVPWSMAGPAVFASALAASGQEKSSKPPSCLS